MKINPILKNESKVGVRTFRFNLMVMLYVGILSIVAMWAYYFINSDKYGMGIDLSNFTILSFALACGQAALLMFIVPVLTATSITGERERQTLDILLSTNLSPIKIVVGKLMSTVTKVALLIVSTMPIYAINFLVGGTSFKELIILTIFFISTTIYVGSIGIFMSTVFKSSKSSTVASILTVLFIVIGTIIIGFVVISRDYYNAVSNNTISTFKITLPFWMYINPTIEFVYILIKQNGISHFAPDLINYMNLNKIFIISLINQGIVTVLLILLSAWRLNPVRKSIIKVRR
ncbi:ABC transporter permease subunit [Clostridium sp.]|uniref:ABC transporter permease n=1 Tax=Clostridium sp. TaxID=1506 RepID=UPI0032165A01